MSAATKMIITAAMSAGVIAAALGGVGLGRTDLVAPPVLPIAALYPVDGAFAAPSLPAAAMTPRPASPMVPWH